MKTSPVVVAGLLVLFGVASCSSSALRPQHHPSGPSVAEVTGFAKIPFIGGMPSGPVTVRITGMEARHLALLVSLLPSVSQSQVHCEEPPGLMYRIVFGAGLVAPSRAVVKGYRCAAAVTIAVAGTTTSLRRDATCTLIRAVRKALPERATETQSLSVGCGS
jgi:hypothetical protein